jgi:two-component system, response regulator PhcR
MKPQYTVLLVDDEPDHLKIASKLLGDDYEVLTASGGQEALAILAERSPDIALVDYKMPGMSGTEVLKRMSEITPRCLRFLVTGRSDREILQNAINHAHVHRFVSKPVRYPELMEDVRTSLELRHAQEQVTKAERLALAGDLASRAIHDLNNALQGLATVPFYIDLGTSEDLQAAKSAVVFAQGIMNVCVAEVLAASKGQEPKYVFVQGSLGDLVQSAVSHGRSTMSDRNITVEIEANLPAQSLAMVHCSRLVGNLVRNARDATEKGGQITVKVSRDGDTATQVTVADNGAGIPPEVQARMFQSFNSTKGEHGTGFGLKNCKSIMDAHGGILEYTTAQGRGTTFRARFPLKPR